jgi:hypothetical protein
MKNEIEQTSKLSHSLIASYPNFIETLYLRNMLRSLSFLRSLRDSKHARRDESRPLRDKI